MRLTFKADDLAAAVTWTARYAKPNSNVPILSGLLFQTVGGVGQFWTVTGYDYDHCATAGLETITSSGEIQSFVLHGRWLASLVGKLRGEVTLSVDNGVTTITSGRGRWTLPCMSATDYPAPPEDPPAIGTLPACDLRAALGRVEYATFDDAVIPELTMACLSTTDGHLEVAATDRYRISRTLGSWFDKDQDPFLVDAAAYVQMLPDTSTDATLLYDADTQMVGVACGDRVLVSRGIAPGKFPRVGPFFDPPLPVVVTARRDDLLEAIDQATAGADPKTPVVLAFDADNRSLTLEAKDSALSTASSVEVDAYATETGWTAVKFEYLRDAVKTLNSEYVTFGLVGPNGVQKPIQLAGTDDAEATEWVPDTTHQQLIMPIRYER